MEHQAGEHHQVQSGHRFRQPFEIPHQSPEPARQAESRAATRRRGSNRKPRLTSGTFDRQLAHLGPGGGVGGGDARRQQPAERVHGRKDRAARAPLVAGVAGPMPALGRAFQDRQRRGMGPNTAVSVQDTQIMLPP